MTLFHKSTFKSKLYDQNDFYDSFIKDLNDCQNEVVIESPYITLSRMEYLYPVFKRILSNKVRLYIITRDPIDHDDEYTRHQATNEILQSKELGINMVLLRNYHHRKLAIIDKKILWEGSLNILSQSNSQEVMRRIEDEQTANQMFSFLKLGKLIY